MDVPFRRVIIGRNGERELAVFVGDAFFKCSECLVCSKAGGRRICFCSGKGASDGERRSDEHTGERAREHVRLPGDQRDALASAAAAGGHRRRTAQEVGRTAARGHHAHERAAVGNAALLAERGERRFVTGQFTVAP